MTSIKSLLVAPLLLVVGSTAAQAGDFDHTHAALNDLLKTHVKEARVDYAGLKSHRKGLDDYLARVAAVGRPEFDGWDQPRQLALLINTYNATTLQLIIDHYPVKSIKDIGSWLKGPWDQPVVHLWGRTFTLNQLEHEILRKRYTEPRIHFALVCAAKGCPPLRAEAYVGTRLDDQLDDQAHLFLANAAKNRVDARRRTVYLSPIFKWYGEDFEKASGSVLAALKPWWPGKPSAGYEQFKIRYTDYDWSLNDQASR